ncbi:MAG: hypothetical protein R3C30_07370 [Hyphomonadaceae bacterium]
MRSGVLALIFGLAAFSAAGHAAAEQVALQCRQPVSESYELHPTEGVVNETSAQPDVTIVFDTDTGRFSLGTTGGSFIRNERSYIGMAHQPPFSGAWEIDRQTGRMMAMGHAVINGSMVMILRDGQCSLNGRVPF